MRILIIQTAFLGDVILITPMIRELKKAHSKAEIDVLVRKGNETLLSNNPHINQLFVWNKNKKFASLFENLFAIRKRKYDEVICVQRYFNAGFLSAFSKARHISGFKQNPWSFLFNYKTNHLLSGGNHEVERNFQLVEHLISKPESIQPEIFPSASDFELVKKFQPQHYYCMAPASVWFTKQLPESKWIELIKYLPDNSKIYLLGAPSDVELCERIRITSQLTSVENLCGKLSLLQSAALIQKAERNFVNDSGPLHLCSAMNAPVTAFFCSTIEDFGFGPLSEDKQILETPQKLECRPCGSHGFKKCPMGHFKCGNLIDVTNSRT